MTTQSTYLENIKPTNEITPEGRHIIIDMYNHYKNQGARVLAMGQIARATGTTYRQVCDVVKQENLGGEL